MGKGVCEKCGCYIINEDFHESGKCCGDKR